jgi:hypothetical protein
MLSPNEDGATDGELPSAWHAATVVSAGGGGALHPASAANARMHRQEALCRTFTDSSSH